MKLTLKGLFKLTNAVLLISLMLVNPVYAEIEKKVKVSSNDTTAGYLNGKLVAGSGVSFAEGSDGSNETLTITATGGTDTANEFLYIEGSTANASEQILGSDDPSTDRTFMFPNDDLAAGDVLIGDGANSLAYLGLATTEILIGDGSGAPTAAALSGDATMSNGGVVTIASNAVALGTDTVNNYVATIADSGSSTITVSGSGSETAAVTLEAIDVTCSNCIDGTDIAYGSDAQGDVAYYNGTDWARLAAGTNGNVLVTQGAGANPTWGGITADSGGDITDVFSCSTGDCTAPVIATGERLDGGTATVDGTNEGILLPRGTSCSSATSDSQICWDSDDDVLYVGNGTTVTTISSSGDISAVGDVTSGAAFDGTSGTILTFDDVDGDKTFKYDTTNNWFEVNDELAIGSAGVLISDDSDGAITLKGMGNGSDEDLTINLDDTSNVGTVSSSTSLATINFSSIALQESGIAVLSNDEIDASSELAAIMDDETGSGLLVFGTDPVFSTSIQIPNGASPTVNAAGEIAEDTTATQLIFGATPFVASTAGEHSFSFNLSTPVDADDNIQIKAHKRAITITDVYCEVDGTTSTALTISDGSNALEAITCDADGAEDDGSIANGTFTARERMEFDLGSTSGSPTNLFVEITYTEDRV